MLRKGMKPLAPYYHDWWQRQQYPKPVFLTKDEDISESCQSSHVNTEDMEGVDQVDSKSDIIPEQDCISCKKEQFETPGGPDEELVEIKPAENHDPSFITPKKKVEYEDMTPWMNSTIEPQVSSQP